MSTVNTKRVFFALLPDKAARQKIICFQRHCAALYPSARPVAEANLHITLHFIGQLDTACVTDLQQEARQVSSGPVDCLLDCSGYFARPKVFWMGCRQVSASLLQLQQTLGHRLQALSLASRFEEYIPHVSLLRKFVFNHDALPTAPDIPLYFREFSLMESISTPDGVKYQIIESYTLK